MTVLVLNNWAQVFSVTLNQFHGPKLQISRCFFTKSYLLIMSFAQAKRSTVNVLKISYTKVSDKLAYAYSEDPDQTAPEGAV